MAIKVSGTEVISDDKRILNNEDLPDIRPSLLLDFANSKTLDPRITFTRGSTATYWDGKTTAKAEENLLKYSQNFDNTGNWGPSTTGAITANQTTAPDGTATADLYTTGTTAGAQNTIYTDNNLLSANSTYTLSAYVKNNGADYVFLSYRASAASYAVVEFNVSTGAYSRTFVANWTVDDYSITDVGNSWYRLTMTFSTDGSSFSSESQRIGVSDGTAGITSGYFLITANGTDGFYIWGAQLENRSSATAYTATTTTPIVKYQPVLQTAASGEARFDHDPVTGESKGLLIEEGRTNLVTQSEAFDDAEWSKVRTSVEADIVVAPDGTLSADKLVEDTTASNSHYLLGVITKDSSVRNYTASVYLKAAERTKAFVYFRDTSFVGARTGVIDLSAGTIGAAGISTGGTVLGNTIEDVGNGWYRVSLSMTSTTDTSQRIEIYAADDSGNATYTGDGYSGIYVWGAQLEEGSFPTSYIPTSGSTVTRAVDAAVIMGDNFTPWYRQDEGTVLVDFEYQYAIGGGFPRPIEIGSSSTAINRLNIYSSNASGNLIAGGRTNDVAEVSILLASAPDSPVSGKVSFAFTEDDSAASFNGVVSGTDTTCQIISNIPRDALGIGGGVNDTNSAISGTISKIAYYPKRLPNATLQAMTEA